MVTPVASQLQPTAGRGGACRIPFNITGASRCYTFAHQRAPLVATQYNVRVTIRCNEFHSFQRQHRPAPGGATCHISLQRQSGVISHFIFQRREAPLVVSPLRPGGTTCHNRFPATAESCSSYRLSTYIVSSSCRYPAPEGATHHIASHRQKRYSPYRLPTPGGATRQITF